MFLNDLVEMEVLTFFTQIQIFGSSLIFTALWAGIEAEMGDFKSRNKTEMYQLKWIKT